MRPVIIIGAARSGTKFLRDILGSGDNAAAIPFDVNYIWREGSEHRKDDELDPLSLSLESRNSIRKALLGQARKSSRREFDVLIEKTVSNSLRVDYVDAVFPDALYVYLTRDGRDVVESAYRCWNQKPDIRYVFRKLRSFPFKHWRYGLWYLRTSLAPMTRAQSLRTWGPRYSGLAEDLRDLPLMRVVARQWKRSVELSEEHFQRIDPARVFRVRYESLIDSADVVESVCRFAGVSGINGVLRRYEQSLNPPCVNGWLTRLNAEQRALVIEEIGGTLSRLGYTKAATGGE